MYCYERIKRYCLFRSFIFFLILSLTSASIFPQSISAQTLLGLPPPGTMVTPTAGFIPPRLIGIKIFPDEPFRFDFIMDTGQADTKKEDLEKEGAKLIKYFLAALTVPEEDIWVNLSPYESERIIPKEFGMTGMGRDLLAQDYMLKQLTASLMYPDEKLGKEFWDKVYQKAYELYGTTEIPVNTFNKVWIVPGRAVIYEDKNGAIIGESRMEVMLEEDYLALEANLQNERLKTEELKESDVKELSGVSSKIVKEVIIPAIEKEVNEGENFASLRQVHYSLLLAAWFKRRLKESLLGKAYMDRKKVAGIELEDKHVKEKIYAQYIESFKRGVYDYIREDYDPHTQQLIPKKYFSGGYSLNGPEGNYISQRTSFIPAANFEGVPVHDIVDGKIFTLPTFTVAAHKGFKESAKISDSIRYILATRQRPDSDQYEKPDQNKDNAMTEPGDGDGPAGMDRRDFLKKTGKGSLALALLGLLGSPGSARSQEKEGDMEIDYTAGDVRIVMSDEDWTLLSLFYSLETACSDIPGGEEHFNEIGKSDVLGQLSEIFKSRNYMKQQYYLAATILIDIANASKAPPRLRARALEIYKTDYKSWLKTREKDFSPEIMRVAYNAVELRGIKKDEEIREEIKGKFGRYPQGITFYLSVPEVVAPLVEAYRELEENGVKEKVDFYFFVGAAFAEGYIVRVRDFIKGFADIQGKTSTLAPMGLDRFLDKEKELKKGGLLPEKYNGCKQDKDRPLYRNEAGDIFERGEFRNMTQTLVALAALLKKDERNFLDYVRGRFEGEGFSVEDLTEDEVRVGTYLYYVANNAPEYIDRKGPRLVGKFNLAKHGNPYYNAQWPAATAQYLSNNFSDEFTEVADGSGRIRATKVEWQKENGKPTVDLNIPYEIASSEGVKKGHGVGSLIGSMFTHSFGLAALAVGIFKLAGIEVWEMRNAGEDEKPEQPKDNAMAEPGDGDGPAGMDRRDFLKKTGKGSLALALLGLLGSPGSANSRGSPDVEGAGSDSLKYNMEEREINLATLIKKLSVEETEETFEMIARSDVLGQLSEILKDSAKYNVREYYRAADILFSIAMSSVASEHLQEEALRIYKKDYKNYLKTKAADFSPEIMNLVYRTVELVGTKKDAEAREAIKDKFKRAPQGILYWLSVPEVVAPLVQAYNALKKHGVEKKVDFDFFVGAALAEGYNIYAREIIRYPYVFLTTGYPIGQDRFLAVEAELKKDGFLPEGYNGCKLDERRPEMINEAMEQYPFGKFRNITQLLIAFAALLKQDERNFLDYVRGRFEGEGFSVEDLTEDEVRVGTYLYYVANNAPEYIDRKGPRLVGKFTLAKHGNPYYNAQWPVATAQYLRRSFPDDMRVLSEMGENIEAEGMTHEGGAVHLTLKVKTKSPEETAQNSQKYSKDSGGWMTKFFSSGPFLIGGGIIAIAWGASILIRDFLAGYPEEKKEGDSGVNREGKILRMQDNNMMDSEGNESGVKNVASSEIRGQADAIGHPQTNPDGMDRSAKGGIDFDPAKIDMEIRNRTEEFTTPFDVENEKNIDFDGLYPIILDVIGVPVNNIPLIMGSGVDVLKKSVQYAFGPAGIAE